MALVAVQVHCPFCNAAQRLRDQGAYLCEFCLQSFSVQQAEREQRRLGEEIDVWLEHRIGAAAGGSAAIDATSRAFIFQNKMLPDLRRDVDRALEVLGDHAQYPLVEDPLGTSVDRKEAANPLRALRSQILGFKSLRARLASRQITAFAIATADQNTLEKMDQKITNLLHLSNVADASAARTSEGYAAARKNLEILAAGTEKFLSGAGAEDQNHAAFLGAMSERFRCLADVCGIYEEVASPNPISGAAIARRLAELSQRLKAAATAIEASGYSPVETLPSMLGVQKEASGCDALARWLQAFDVVARRADISFSSFRAEMSALFGTANASAASDAVEVCAEVIRASRGEIVANAVEDFAWVPSWVERIRSKKTLVVFGREETVVDVDEFLLPVWLADVTYSRSAGKFFKEGIEGRCSALVEACTASFNKVVVLDDDHPLHGALFDQKPLSGRTAALPRSTRAGAISAIQPAVRATPGIMNATVKIRGLAFLPAAVARLSSKKGDREVMCCLDGKVPMDSGAVLQLQAARELRRRFG